MSVRLVLAAAVAVMLAFAATHLSLRTEITHFLPEEVAGEAASLSRALADAELTRGMVLSLAARDAEGARDAAAALARTLRGHPEIVSARVGPEAGLADDVQRLALLHSVGFLTDDPDHPQRGLAARLSEQGLRTAARAWRERLSGPGGSAFAPLAARDPLGSVPAWVDRVRDTDPGLRVEGGQFMAIASSHALVLVQTRPRAFDTARQAPLLAAIEDAFAALQAERPDDELELEASGINRFGVRIERTMRSETAWIGAFGILGVSGLFLLCFRSLRALGLVLLPAGVGILAAICVGILILGDLDLLTLAFGASLTGVAIDYAIHLVTHHALAGEGTDPWTTARRLRSRLAVGALTTMASYAGLLATGFPGFREMGLFSIVGIAGALLVTLVALPALLPPAGTPAPRLQALADACERGVARARGRRGVLWMALVGSLVVVAIGIPRLRFTDDLRGLSQLDPELLAEDGRVRARLSAFDTSRLVITRGADEEQVLRRNQRVHDRLEDLRAAGVLEGMRSLHALLLPASVQRRNHERVRADAELPSRLDRIFASEGFVEGSFSPFAEALQGPAPEPLSLRDLRTTSLAPLVDSMVFAVGDDLAVATFLRGVRSEAELEAALEDLPGARWLDQTGLLDDFFGGFRATTLRQMAAGSLLVVLVLVLRYRDPRRVIAAFAPSALTALLLLGLLGLSSVEANLLHVMSLLLVLGMGVDYGIFLVDASREEGSLGTTVLSLWLSALTTLFVFGALALATHPALRAIGVTTGLGVLFAFLLAPGVQLLVAKDTAPASE